MIYISSDSLSPYFNFALEYYLMTEKNFDLDEVLLFWRTKPTLMVGRYQNIQKEINLDYVLEKKYNIVRRLSGGGTIYTDEGGCQYSFISKRKESDINFSKYTTPIIEALNSLGIEAYLNGRNDLLVDGKKFSGNAQCSLNGHTLHHGSLLFDTNLDEIEKCLTVSPDKIISKGIASVRDRVTNLKPYMKENITVNEFKIRMIENLLGNNGNRYVLNKIDLNKIEKIANEKFSNWEWTVAKEPKFTIHNLKRFAGGLLDISVAVEDGYIKECQINGDFFALEDIEKLTKKLVGCKYDKDAISNLLGEICTETIIYKISNDDILSCII